MQTKLNLKIVKRRELPTGSQFWIVVTAVQTSDYKELALKNKRKSNEQSPRNRPHQMCKKKRNNKIEKETKE